MRPKLFCNVVALVAAIFLSYQIHLYVGHIATATQIVMADETVKGYRCRSAHIVLIIHNQWLCGKVLPDFTGNYCGAFQSGSFGHIDHYLHFVFIVERKHFYGNRFGKEHANRSKKQDYGNPQKQPTGLSVFN